MGQFLSRLVGTAAIVAVSTLFSLAAEPSLSDEDIDEIHDFVIGNALSILFHETGHMLISAFELPVLGREEDAVDNLSTLLLLNWESDDSEQALIDSADAWFFSNLANEDREDETAYYDEHGLDRQRAFQVVCLMVGGDPERFSDFAKLAEMPVERQERCAGDYAQANDAWVAVLEPHVLSENDAPRRIAVDYRAAPENLQYMQETLRDNGVLEDVADFVASNYRLPFPVTYVATSCGAVNAFWNPGDRTVTLCYELMDHYADLIIKDIADRQP